MRKNVNALPAGGEALAESAGFGLVGDALGRDVREAVRAALASGAVFPKGGERLQRQQRRPVRKNRRRWLPQQSPEVVVLAPFPKLLIESKCLLH